MSNDLRARIDALKPKRETVVVDEVELELKAPTLLQYGDFMDAIGAIDPEPLLAAGLPIILSALERGDEASLIRSLAENGAAIWRAITANLGALAAKALAKGVAALLDTETNFRRLVGAKALKEGAAFDADDGAYVGSPALRAWIERNISPEQAIYAAEHGFKLAKVRELGKALLAGMTARRPLTTPQKVNGAPLTPEPTSAAG